MPRWRQIDEIDPATGRRRMVPLDEGARRRDGVFIRGDIEPFVSPIDRTVISSRKQLDEHCRKHDVVPAQEFPPEHYEREARKRADHYEGRRSRAESFARKQEIHEIINRLERNG